MFQDLHIFENPEVILLVASTIFFFSIIAGKAGFPFRPSRLASLFRRRNAVW